MFKSVSLQRLLERGECLLPWAMITWRSRNREHFSYNLKRGPWIVENNISPRINIRSRNKCSPDWYGIAITAWRRSQAEYRSRHRKQRDCYRASSHWPVIKSFAPWWHMVWDNETSLMCMFFGSFSPSKQGANLLWKYTGHRTQCHLHTVSHIGFLVDWFFQQMKEKKQHYWTWTV